VTLAALALAAQTWLSPCIGQEIGPGRCGTYEVWENRDAKTGRKIPIYVMVLPAQGQPAKADPLVFLQGGPGDAPNFNARFYNRVFASLRKTRDLVLIDLRGTGKSAALTCPELGQRDGTGAFDENMLNAGAVRTCRARLEQRADLRLYTTAIVADDLDEVLGALGYPQVNLYGTSYGTRVAQAFMARHPSRIRTVALKGVVPQSMASPESHARAGDDAWRSLVARCRADAVCAKAFPTLAKDFESILARLDRKPAALTLPESKSRPATTITVTRGLFGEGFRNVLYSPEAAAGAPKLIHRLATGEDDAGLAETALASRTLAGGDRLAAGFFLSVSCTEDVPFVPKNWTPLTTGTFGGDYRLRQQSNACAEWPRGATSPEHRQLVRSNIPTLLMSGEFDPVTPPSGGEEVLKGLSRGRHVVVRNNGHPIGSAEACIGAMIEQLIDAGTTTAVQTACAESIPRVPFILDGQPR
jgi:pimeloyl-ACP methyl ester carboxylesterase